MNHLDPAKKQNNNIKTLPIQFIYNKQTTEYTYFHLQILELKNIICEL